MDNFIAYYISYFQDKWKYYICIEKGGLLNFVKAGISYPIILLTRNSKNSPTSLGSEMKCKKSGKERLFCSVKYVIMKSGKQKKGLILLWIWIITHIQYFYYIII